MRDDFSTIASQVYAATGQQIDYGLCEMAVRDSFRELRERVNWSWLLKRGVLTLAAPYSIGLASFTQYGSTVTGSGTSWTASMIGRQIRSGIGDPYYTITSVVSSTSLTIDPPWADSSSLTPSAYSIFTGYIVPPDDFFSFVVVKDPQRTHRLHLNIDQSALDLYDPRRSSTGQPILLSPVDYAPSYSGRVYGTVPVLQSSSTNPYPTAAGTYTGSADALFVVQILLGGAVDTATFRWKKDSASSWTSGGVCSSLGNILPEGVGLSWLAGTYVASDTFVIRTSAVSNPGLPRFEPWPKPSAQIVLQFQYLSRYPDLDEPGTVLPRFIPGNVVKEGAYAKVARLPGTDAKPNPFAQIARAENYENRFDSMIVELMRQDEEVFVQSIQDDSMLPLFPLPWAYGARSSDFDYPFDPYYY